MSDATRCAIFGRGLFGILVVPELTQQGIDVYWYSKDPEPSGI